MYQEEKEKLRKRVIIMFYSSKTVQSLAMIGILSSALLGCGENNNYPPAPPGLTPPSQNVYVIPKANSPAPGTELGSEPNSPHTMEQPTLNHAFAEQLPDYSYRFVLTGENLEHLRKAKEVQVEVGGATVTLIKDGQIAIDNTLITAAILPQQIVFDWKYPGAPTDWDRVQVDYRLNPQDSESETAPQPLLVPFDNV